MENIDVNEIINRLEGAAQALFERGVSGTFAIGVVLTVFATVSAVVVTLRMFGILKVIEHEKDSRYWDDSSSGRVFLFGVVGFILSAIAVTAFVEGLPRLLTPELVVFDQLMPF